MIRVYRVEHREDRCGPFRRDHARLAPRGGWKGQVLPPPYEEQLAIGGDWHCGVDRLEKSFDWFDDEDRRALSNHGFVLAVYEVPPEDVQTGHHQVTFVRPSARLVQELDPSSLDPVPEREDRPALPAHSAADRPEREERYPR